MERVLHVVDAADVITEGAICYMDMKPMCSVGPLNGNGVINSNLDVFRCYLDWETICISSSADALPCFVVRDVWNPQLMLDAGLKSSTLCKSVPSGWSRACTYDGAMQSTSNIIIAHIFVVE